MTHRKKIWSVITISLGIAVGTLALYHPLLSHEFINYDDDWYVTKNPMVLPGLTWPGVETAFTKVYASNWHPLTWVSHMLDCQWYGLQPAGHHLTSLLLHTVNAVLLFILLQTITGRLWRSAATAGLFAWHPLQIESVAWVAERKDVLSTCFALLTLLAYARYVGARIIPSGNPGDSRSVTPVSPVVLGRSTGYILALLCFALGLMSKPMLVTLPFVLLLLDFWPFNRVRGFTLAASVDSKSSVARYERGLGKLLIEKLPFFALSVLSCVITFNAQRRSGAMTLFEPIPTTARIANALVSYVRYVDHAIFPRNLAVFYPHPHSWPFYQVIGAGLILALLTTLALRRIRRSPFVIVGWLWFLGTLIPVIGLVQVGEQAMADRYTYLPLIGLIIIFVWGTAELTHRWCWRSRLLTVLSLAALAGCAFATANQLPFWKNSRTLFARALAVTKDNFIAHNNLGVALFESGDYDEAARHYAEAIRINPLFPNAHSNLGNVFGKLRKPTQAIAAYEAALRLTPDEPEVHFNLAVTLAETGQWEDAARHFATAIRLKPNEPEFRFDHGVVLGRLGRTDEAIREFGEAISLKPNLVPAHEQLALVLIQSGKLDAAASEYRKVLELTPGRADIAVTLGSLLETLGRRNEVIACYQEALRHNPASAHLHSNLGIALARNGDSAAATEQFRAVLQVEPENADAHYNLGNTLLTQGDHKGAAQCYERALQINPKDAAAQRKLAACRAEEEKSRTNNASQPK